MTLLLEVICIGQEPERFYLAKEPTSSLDLDGVTRFWEPKLLSAGSFQLQLSESFGGYVRVNFGEVTITPDALVWPPPLRVDLKVAYRHQSGDLEEVFICAARLFTIQSDQSVYKLYPAEYPQDLLMKSSIGMEIIDEEQNPVSNGVIPLYFGSETTPKALHLIPRMIPQPGDTDNQSRFFRAGLMAGETLEVYDDGVLVNSNIKDAPVEEDHFLLEPKPVGEVRIKGISRYGGTLLDIFSFACGIDRLNLTLEAQYARNPSPIVSFYVSEQIRVIDFLDQISAAYSHMFYIKGNSLVLVDMLGDNGTLSLSDFEYFSSSYRYKSPVKRLISQWSYLENGINQKGMPLYLTRQKSQFVESNQFFGLQKDIKVFPQEENNSLILGQLSDIAEILNRPEASLRLPFDYGLVKPGTRIDFLDNNLFQATTVYLHARTIQYDFDSEEVSVVGEGDYFGTRPAPQAGGAVEKVFKEIKGAVQQKKYYTISAESPAEGDFTSLSEAVSALKPFGGGNLFLKRGQHRVDSQIDFGSYAWEIKGENRYDSMIVMELSDPAKSALCFDQTTHRVLIENLCFSEDATTGYHSFISAVNSTGGNPTNGSIEISNCLFNYTLGNALDLFIDQIRINDCRFLTTSDASAQIRPVIAGDGYPQREVDMSVTGCLFYEGQGILHQAKGGNLIIRDCLFFEQRDIAVEANSLSAVIEGNRIAMKGYLTPQTGKTVARKGILCNLGGGTISNNYVVLKETLSVNWGFEAIDVVDQTATNGAVVSGNVVEIQMYWSEGHQIEAIEVHAYSAVVSSNALKMTINAENTDSQISGIRVKSCFVSVNGNQLEIVKTQTAQDVGIKLLGENGLSEPIGCALSGNVGVGWTSLLEGNWAKNQAQGNINY
ncbi:MAG: hypothetical protein OEY59_00975 [Deltaproteobacteria bacterium]|nr:hypothetical protein [Deltaproteobacteria bacterium]